MTTHTEDAMTRERALEEALREIAEFSATEPWRITAKAMKEIASNALASAQREPAPSADAEEIVAQIMSEYLAPRWNGVDYRFTGDGMKAVVNTIVAVALRRYAGDGGVSDSDNRTKVAGSH